MSRPSRSSSSTAQGYSLQQRGHDGEQDATAISDDHPLHKLDVEQVSVWNAFENSLGDMRTDISRYVAPTLVRSLPEWVTVQSMQRVRLNDFDQLYKTATVPDDNPFTVSRSKWDRATASFKEIMRGVGSAKAAISGNPEQVDLTIERTLQCGTKVAELLDRREIILAQLGHLVRRGRPRLQAPTTGDGSREEIVCANDLNKVYQNDSEADHESTWTEV